jgi:hypothetical protein
MNSNNPKARIQFQINFAKTPTVPLRHLFIYLYIGLYKSSMYFHPHKGNPGRTMQDNKMIHAAANAKARNQ